MIRFRYRAGCAAVAMSLVLGACGGDPPPYPPPPARTFVAPTAKVEKRQIPVLYTTTGTVVSDERVEISSRTTAYVSTMDVREGERVRRGQLLATLDSKDIEAGVSMALAERDRAGAADADAQRDLEDSEKLVVRGVVSQAHRRKAMLQRESARQSLQAAEASLARAQAERQYTRIVSPVSGVVVARHRRSGDLASPGSPLVTVESDTALLFETHVVEKRVSKIAIGDPVLVIVDALERPLEGEVIRLVASGDPMTRGFEVKIAIPQAPGLHPGMFGRAQFAIGSRTAMVVPTDALVERGGLTGVYVLDEHGMMRFRWLRTEHRADEGQIAVAGLDEGERIVAAPNAKMREGDRVVGP